MTTYYFGNKSLPEDNIVLNNQTIASDVVPLDAIFLDTSGIWQKSFASTQTPTGIYQGLDSILGKQVILHGVVTTTGLSGIGSAVYLEESLGLKSIGKSDLLDKDMSIALLDGWSDLSTNDGTVTQELFLGEQVYKFNTSGTVSSDAEIQRNIGAIGSTFTASIRLYHQAIGTLANLDYFLMVIHGLGFRLGVSFASDGLFINDGVSDNEVGTNLIKTLEWQEWTFDVDGTVPASATCDVYLDGELIATAIDCSNTTATEGLVNIKHEQSITLNRISYVDFLKIGTGLTKKPAVTHTISKTKLGHVLSATELLVDIDAKTSNPGSKAGYMVAGLRNPASIKTTSVEKFNFESEASYVIASTISVLEGFMRNSTNSTKIGYVNGGTISPSTDTSSFLDKLTFITDATGSVASNLTNVNANRGWAGQVQSGVSGFFGMGNDSGVFPSNISKLVFSNENTEAVTSTLPVACNYVYGFSSASKGYISGGNNTTPAPETKYSNIRTLVFNNDNTIDLTSKLSIVRSSGAGLESNSNGYIVGSYGPASTTTIEKIPFSTEVSSGISSKLGGVRELLIPFSSNNSGYVAGGGPGVVPDSSSITKLEFSTDVLNNVSSIMALQKIAASGLSNK